MTLSDILSISVVYHPLKTEKRTRVFNIKMCCKRGIYMKNLRKIEAESFYCENELIKRAQGGDIWARNQVIENNMPLVKKIAAKSIQKSSLSDSDLIQEGIFGIVTAIEKFDLSLGYKFSTYPSWWIKQAMFKAISEQSYALNIPVYIQETLSRYNKTKQEMEQKEHKEVSKKDVAKKLNLSEEKIDTFLNCFNRALSIEQGASLTDNKELTLAEIIEDEKQNVEREVIDIELKKDINRALEILKEKEKNVITLRFGLDNSKKKTLEEIGESYGVTKECIRQIEKRALNKIAQDEFYKNCLISYIK